jgi:hypothetical protein
MPIKTYVLIGYNQAQEDAAYSQRKDVIILRPKVGESIAEVAAKIHGPANIILQCHGGEDGTFTWHENESKHHSYTELFQALPRSGILSITLGSCYGGTAQRADILSAAPPGCLVQSITGEKTPSSKSVTPKFAAESKFLTNPTDLFLEALDNFHPARYKEFQEYGNKKLGAHDITDPDMAMPHMIGLGGKPPLRIDIKAEMKQLTHADKAAMARAIARVQDRFDTECRVTYVNEKGQKELDGFMEQSLGDPAEKALDGSIATMAAKLQKGYVPQNVDERKLAYAITAAYLDESSAFRQRMEKQPDYLNPHVDYAKEAAAHPELHKAKAQRLDELGIHNAVELERYIKDANAGEYFGFSGKGIDVKEFKKIVEAGWLLGQRIVVTQGEHDSISLPNSPFKKHHQRQARRPYQRRAVLGLYDSAVPSPTSETLNARPLAPAKYPARWRPPARSSRRVGTQHECSAT